MEDETLNTIIPAWKLEIIKNRAGNKSSASFSHYDRTRTVRPQPQTESGQNEAVKTQDIIKFFNKSTDGSTRLSSSRSFSCGQHQRQGWAASGVGTRDRREQQAPASSPGRRDRDSGTGMWSGDSEPGPVQQRRQPDDDSGVSCVSSPARPGCGTGGQRSPGAPWLSRDQADPGVTVESRQQTRRRQGQGHIQRSLSFSVLREFPGTGLEDDTGSESEVMSLERGSYLEPGMMGEDTRLYISNNTGPGAVRLAGGGVGARLYRGQRQGGRRTGGDGDSDGMMGSGGESDSSEEIHYGPGFVSRLKSRYMSVALRGSPRGSLGTLRRTASLEFFLDMDKECAVEEVELDTPPALPMAGVALSGVNHGIKTTSNSKRESMKRAQSVEVLSHAAPAASPVLPLSLFEGPGLEAAPPPCESPPPLPPRERDTPLVHGVLSQNPALVNDSIVIAEKKRQPQSPPKPRPSAAVSKTKPAAKGGVSAAAGAKTLPSKRASTGVLFGVKDKELPAPDIVKQTRKLFEAGSGTGSSRKFGAKSGMTKAKSTSSLYSRPTSRSNSFDTPLTKTGRKKSEEDMTSRPPFLTSGSPARRSSRSSAASPARKSSTSSPARTPRLPSKPGAGSGVTSRPALPAKPSHLSPMVSGKPVSSAIVERHVQKVTPTKIVSKPGAFRDTSRPSAVKNSTGGSGLVKASVATVIPSDSRDASKDLGSKSIQLNLHPINIGQSDSENDADMGVKRVSASSIQNIRNSGNHVNFKFDDKKGAKNHLPGMENKKVLPPKQVGVIRPISRAHDSNRAKDGDKSLAKETSKEPVTETLNNRVNKVSAVEHKDLNGENKKETLIIEKDPLFVPIESWKENNTQAKNYINKKIHSESSKEAPHVIVSNSVVSSEPKPGLRNGSVGGLAVGRAPPSVPPRNGSKLETPGELGVNGGQRQKYFDTNIEPQPSEKNNFIKTDIVKSVAVGERTVNKNDTVVNKSDPQKAVIGRPEAQETNTVDSTDNKNNYRDSWKSRNDTQNTFTFNFVNSKKDVSHIENDGLDLTNRNKKGVIILDSNGESYDGDASEAEEDRLREARVEASNNFVFVGAEIRTGKSTIRSKQSKRKLNITFNDKTEVFEYPSFESVDISFKTDSKRRDQEDEDTQEDVNPASNNSKQQSSIFKTNSSVGSSGGLGSYTPSKSQMAESVFQLGVSRSSASSSRSSGSSSGSSVQETILLPADDGVSWGSSASSDMLF